jgi:Fe-S oxidoreductase
MEFSDYFYIPFIAGVIYFLAIVVIRFTRWILGLSKIDKIRIWKGLFTKKTLISMKQAFLEGLIHRSIFKKNKVLGYMHMSLAFGWFLLIIIGHFETMAYTKSFHFPFETSIFYRYFVTEKAEFFGAHTFSFVMDFILLFILSGVVLAYFKRIRSKIFGMRKTTKLKIGDRLALGSLWLIFPLRFLAETFTAGVYHNGSFISNSVGKFFASFMPVESLMNPMWISYSFALGLFMVFLPMSRYMHIPTEILFIFIKNYGVKLKKRANTYSRIQVYSCSRCGICLDTCQLNGADIKTTQSVYVLKHIRNRSLTDEVLFNCLLCGKCQQVCPVGVEINDLRITQRIETTLQYNSAYDYLKDGKPKKSDVIYFAGCMTHLTPAIKKSMINIFEYANIDYWFLDEEKAPCCGRPLMQAGQYDAAEKLIVNNQKLISDSGAKTLVVSCPICYKVFREDYRLVNIEVKQHSEYILELVNQNKLPIEKSTERIIYHDPCELGRGSGIYDQPRELLSKYSNLIPINEEKEESLCCGGSLANIKIQMSERKQITDKAIDIYAVYNPEYLVTSCPLCKKTFAKSNKINVVDIAEIINKSIEKQKVKQTVKQTIELEAVV